MYIPGRRLGFKQGLGSRPSRRHTAELCSDRGASGWLSRACRECGGEGDSLDKGRGGKRSELHVYNNRGHIVVMST